MIESPERQVYTARPVKTGHEMPMNGKARLRVLGCRPAPEGGYLVVGRAERGEWVGERRSDRRELRARVMSPEIPGYRALSLNASLHGLLLETEGPVPEGHMIRLELELESQDHPVKLLARVAWCRQRDLKRWHLGVEVQSGLKEHLAPRARPEAQPVPGRYLARRTQFVARLIHYHYLAGKLKIEVTMSDGRGHVLDIPGPRSLQDHRGTVGTELSHFDYEETEQGAVYRLLSPWHEVVLQVSGRASSESLWSLLPPAQPRRIRLPLG